MSEWKIVINGGLSFLVTVEPLYCWHGLLKRAFDNRGKAKGRRKRW
jgi:hypothetical protein